MTTVSYSPQNEIIVSTSAGFPMTPIPVTDVFVTTHACMGSAFSVTTQCENPDRRLPSWRSGTLCPPLRTPSAMAWRG